PAQCATCAGQFGAAAEPRPPTGPVTRAPRRRRVPGRRPAGAPGAPRLRRAAVEVVQLKLLVPQGYSGSRRPTAVLDGLAAGLVAGLGQALTDARPEGELKIQPGRDRRRGPVGTRGEVAVRRPNHLDHQ